MNTIVEEKIAETIVLEDEVDAVTRGALWLDEHLPGWADDIDLYWFNIGDTQQCIVGQLTDNRNLPSSWFADMLGKKYNERYGFEENPYYMMYNELQARWENEIRNRRRSA